MNNVSKEGWISVDERLPDKVGWYRVKTDYGETDAPFARTASNKLVWVVPDTVKITHWKLVDAQ